MTQERSFSQKESFCRDGQAAEEGRVAAEDPRRGAGVAGGWILGVQVGLLLEIARLDAAAAPVEGGERKNARGNRGLFMRGDAEVLDVEIEGQVLVEAEPVLADERGVDDETLAVEGLNRSAEGNRRADPVATGAVLLAFLDAAEKPPLMVDAKTNVCRRADWAPKTGGVECGQAIAKGFFQLEVLMAEDVPGVFVRRTRIKKAVVADADSVVPFAIVNRGNLASAAKRIVRYALGVHVEVPDGG